MAFKIKTRPRSFPGQRILDAIDARPITATAVIVAIVAAILAYAYLAPHGPLNPVEMRALDGARDVR